MRLEIDLFTGEVTTPPKPASLPQPKPVATGNGPMLDASIDQYLRNARTKSGRTAHSYTYTLSQFYNA